MVYYDNSGSRIRRRVKRCTPLAEVVPDDAACAATFREEPMPDRVFCAERGYHQRHTSGGGSEYYTWMNGDEGAGWDR